MRRIIILIVFILLITPALLSAQGRSRMGLDLGAKLGANFSQINGKYWDNGYKANLLAGAYVAVNGPRLGLQVEVLFTQSTYVAGEGFNDLYKDLFQTGKDSIKGGRFKVNYFNVPLLLNIKLFPRVMIQLGPQYSGVVSVRDQEALLTDAEALFKSGTISGVGGLCINLPKNINIGARYVIGLSDINENYDDTKGKKNIEDAWKQRSLQVHIGYTFF